MPAQREKGHLFSEERAELQRLVSKGKTAASKRRRAQILLKAAQSPQGPAGTEEQICEAFAVGHLTGARLRQAFVWAGVESTWQRKQRPHSPVARKLDGDGDAQRIALAGSKPPAGSAKWPMHLDADKLGERQGVESISEETGRRTVKKWPATRG